ncbi:hypothetical protein [Gordonia sp. (in: high G+C Gram-positive bacteria)]|uniref:hypothetical protein n=1 Tax=Gordonia sp. (in: high G+C Gram-positive bacteria) TaxID=84139 RepID=UPI0016B7A332|nr:hypothetical protein [Gordonia sp. (in: high G+C Gram-positive bacteria)]NLG44968.1 hypothetical protein [Gordonia sp. (in: high G+C Gram-positive bacteria)]
MTTTTTGRQRDRVRSLLAEADGPIDAQAVSAALGVHVTTARFHLNNLVDEGSAETVPLAPEGVGRPRVGYRIVVAPPIDELLLMLIAKMGSTPEVREHLAAEAGREWAARHGVAEADPQEMLVPDPVVIVETILTRLGFRITDVMSAFGRHEINLCGCPLQHIGDELPEVARGVVRGIVEQALAAGYQRLGGAYSVTVRPDGREGDCELHLSLERAKASSH